MSEDSCLDINFVSCYSWHSDAGKPIISGTKVVKGTNCGVIFNFHLSEALHYGHINEPFMQSVKQHKNIPMVCAVLFEKEKQSTLCLNLQKDEFHKINSYLLLMYLNTCMELKTTSCYSIVIWYDKSYLKFMVKFFRWIIR